MTSIALSVVVEARRWLGTPYLHQASECGVGADCLGLLRGVWRGVIGPEPFFMPSYSRDWSEPQGREDLWAAAQAVLIERDMELTLKGMCYCFGCVMALLPNIWVSQLPEQTGPGLSMPIRAMVLLKAP